jgi:hypothetical protein
MWGACVPSDCEWGEQATPASDAVDGVIRIRWTPDFAVREMQLSIADDLLRVETHTHFIDNSGRPDRNEIEFFRR